MNRPTNTPFDFLRRKNGDEFLPEVYKNWCKAREYVLERLKSTAFSPNENGHLHAIVVGDSPIVLSVIRQLALSAHYPNFVEYDEFGALTCKNRTVITIMSQNEHIVEELKKEEFLCNLLDYCKYTTNGKVVNASSYIDIEFEIVKELPEACISNEFFITEEDVQKFFGSKDKDNYYVDTKMAVLVGGMYRLGDVIGNVPAENIHNAMRYVQALDRFQYSQMEKDKALPLIDEKKCMDNPIKAKEYMSNLFCADCFCSKYKGMEKCWEDNQEKNELTELKMWEKYNEALSLSEHERWVVEKLIMGYRPLNNAERLKYESLFDDARRAYCKKLKSNAADPAHIDLCSYRDLRRINPDDMKYDSFLMLAIPKILEKEQIISNVK